jgi:transcriptional regulator with XRE-family HTH domain
MDDLLLALTPADVERELGRRLRAERKRRGWTQAELAARSDLSVATIARLEATGQGQLSSLVRAVWALGRLADFTALLEPRAPRSMAELRRLRAGREDR